MTPTIRDQAPVLVTGAAGFIGFHVAKALLDAGIPVIGVDSLNAYYDPALKIARLREIGAHPEFAFHRLDLSDRAAAETLFDKVRPGLVIHLAAQAGVRHSLVDPHAYIDANISGFLNVLEGCRKHKVGHLVYASSSSVYGADRDMPFSAGRGGNHPVSLYGATKRANELMAHAYSHLYGFPTTGLRFFTVYGPWGRPDMAYFAFTEAILQGKPIPVFNHGNMARDFTYIDDIVEGVLRVAKTPSTEPPGWRLYNIGNHAPVPLMHLIGCIERALGIKSRLELKPMQPGDVVETFADVDDLIRDVGFSPSTPIEAGIGEFVEWYLGWREQQRVAA